MNTHTQSLLLTPGKVTLKELRQIYEGNDVIGMDPAAWQAVAAAESVVSEVIASGRTVYGINTARKSRPLPQRRHWHVAAGPYRSTGHGAQSHQSGSWTFRCAQGRY
jgi:hypothetical protein